MTVSSGTFRGAPVFCLLAAVIGPVQFYLYAQYAGSTGDEFFYFRNARALGLWYVGEGPAPDLIDRGWHMPGLSILLSPSQVLGESLHAARTLMFVANAAVLGLCMLLSRHVFSARIATAYGALVAILPLTSGYAFLLWGDLLAGQGSILAVLLLVAATRGRGLNLGFVILAALVTIATFFLRSNFLTLIPLLVGGLILHGILAPEDFRGSSRNTAKLGIGVLVVIASLAALWPWSAAVSERFESRVLTTTSKDLALIANYADKAFMEELEDLSRHPGINIFLNMRARAETSGLPVAVYMKQERRRILAEVDGWIVVEKLQRNIRTLYEKVGNVVIRNCKRFILKQGSDVAEANCALLERSIPVAAITVSLGAFFFMVLTIGHGRIQVLAIVLLKGLIVSFLALPLFHWGHNGRYLHSFAPALTLGSVLFIAYIRRPGWRALANLGWVKGTLVFIPHGIAAVAGCFIAYTLFLD